MNFTGVVTPLVTPFTADGHAVDEDALRRLVDAQVDDGVGGLIACGTTGEFTTLTLPERQRIAEIIIEQTAGHVPVMVQTGSTATADVKALSAHAQSIGASALLLPPPFYGSLTSEELENFYREVAASVTIPVCIYNIPAATGVGMSVDFMVKLAENVPGIQFVKDSTGDLTQQTILLEGHSGSLTLLCGEELLIGAGLLLGLTGAVVGCANVLSRGMIRLMDAGAAQDFNEVARLNALLTPLMKFIISHPYIATVKEAMAIAGIGTGPVREPLQQIAPASHEELTVLVKSLDADLLTSAATV